MGYEGDTMKTFFAMTILIVLLFGAGFGMGKGFITYQCDERGEFQSSTGRTFECKEKDA